MQLLSAPKTWAVFVNYNLGQKHELITLNDA